MRIAKFRRLSAIEWHYETATPALLAEPFLLFLEAVFLEVHGRIRAATRSFIDSPGWYRGQADRASTLQFLRAG